MAIWQGALLMFIRAASGSVGKNMQRYAKRPGRHLPMQNFAGVVLKTLCGPLDTLAYSLGPQTTLAPLSMSLGLLLDFFAAPVVHGDSVPIPNIIAAVTVVAGTAVCLMYGAPDASVPLPPPTSAALAIYAVVASAACAAPISMILARRRHPGRFDALLHAALGALLGSMTLVAGKAIIADLRNPSAAFAAPFSSLAHVLATATVVPAHLYVLNRSFGRYSLVILSPASGALGLIANLTTGFLLYSESPKSVPRFLSGIGLLICGVLGLVAHQPSGRAAKASEAVARDLHDSYGHLHPRHLAA